MCLPLWSGLLTGGEGTDCPLPTLVPSSFTANVWPLLPPFPASILANTWPLLPPALARASLLILYLPQPQPTSCLVRSAGALSDHPMYISLCYVATGGADPWDHLRQCWQGCFCCSRGHSHSGYPSAHYHLGWARWGPNHLKGVPPCSALARPTSLPCLGWWGLRMMPQVVGRVGSTYFKINCFKGCPIMGSKLYSMGAPIMG